ncbi:flagellar assembly protein A [Radiobacillus deserti]|nr:FapA family protein [Radiobacillus deserti]
MQSIISKGKNIEEAIHLGLKILNSSKSEVEIEILRMENTGFIGLGKKPAVVKLSLNNKQHVTEITDGYTSMEQIVEDLTVEEAATPVEGKYSHHTNSESKKGKAWVQDNVLFVMDSPSHYSTVTIGEGIQLRKNNIVVTDKSTVVSEKDDIILEYDKEKVQETQWEISINKEKLAVFLNVNPGYIAHYHIANVEPNEHIALVLEERREIKNTLTYQDVITKLQELQVAYGVHPTEILKALKSTDQRSYQIATGKNSIPGVDGRVEIVVDTNMTNSLKEDQHGKVDFRERKIIPAVQKGEIVAIIHPPIPGEAGILVTNEPLRVSKVHPIVVKVGDGIVMEADKLIATESGRPHIEQRGQLVKANIYPKLVHEGNINLESGNIRFSGDVEVLGEVQENMLVEADGDILVHRSVSEAKLDSLNSITIKGNVIGSEISAGKNNMLVAELGHLLGTMYEQIKRMIAVINQLTNSPGFKSNDFLITGLQPLIKILVEKKFKGFIDLAKKYQLVMERGKNYFEKDDGWVQISDSINRIFMSLSTTPITLDHLLDLSESIKGLYIISETPVEPNSYITVSDAIHSRLYCSGNVNITGKGCINTKVHAGGKLIISGVVRGGQVYGRLGVEVYEVGSNSGTKTTVAVPHDQTIKMTRVMEGAVLKIGNVSYTLQEDRKDVEAYLDENNQIVFK